MTRVRTTAATVCAVLLLAAIPAGAEDLAPRIDPLTATAGATGVEVSGTGQFAAPAVVVSEDPSGDAAIPMAGMDLTGASITQLSNALLRFQIDIADQTPGLSAAPQAVYYNWPIGVKTGTQMAQFNLQAMRADMYTVATAGGSAGAPVFRLQTCEPNPQTGGNTCSVTAQLNGEFGDGYVAIDVPTGTIGARAASAITAGAQPINANLGAGAVWFNGASQWADSMPPVEDYALGRTVTLGAAPAGTAPEDVALTQPAALTNTNRFTEIIAGASAGSVIAAQVCAAGVCTLQSTIAQ
jgi:hypothetical protein